MKPPFEIHLRARGYGLRITRTPSGWLTQWEAPDRALAWALTFPRFAWQAIVAAERDARVKAASPSRLWDNKAN